MYVFDHQYSRTLPLEILAEISLLQVVSLAAQFLGKATKVKLYSSLGNAEYFKREL